MSLARFKDLEVRLYKLTTKSHLRVGAGEGATEISAVELPLIRALFLEENGSENGLEGRRVPYLPASSLHGVVRSWVEKAIRSKEDPIPESDLEEMPRFNWAQGEAGRNLKSVLGREFDEDEVSDYWEVYPTVCDPMLDVDRCEIITENANEDKRRWLDDIADWESNGVQGKRRPCTVCAIFGYPGQRGKVRFTHAFPSTEELQVDIITRVAINRLTGAADEGKLFDLEAIPPGVDFYFFVTLENLDADTKKRFDMGIRALHLQLAALGAHSTVGFGMVDVKRMYRAEIKPGVFDLNAPVEKIIPDIVASGDYEPRVHLDTGKYPDFFLALSMQRKTDQQLPDERFRDEGDEKQVIIHEEAEGE